MRDLRRVGGRWWRDSTGSSPLLIHVRLHPRERPPPQNFSTHGVQPQQSAAAVGNMIMIHAAGNSDIEGIVYSCLV